MCLLYLCMISLLCTGVYTQGKAKGEIAQLSEDMRKGHFLWLEALYYARNEIYDETLWKWEENGQDYHISVTFERFKKLVHISTRYKDMEKSETYAFDFDCHCIYDEEKQAEELE